MPAEPISSPSYPAASSTANATLHLGGQLLGSMSRDQLRFCTSVVRNLKRNKKAVPFLEPVDPIKLNIPNYNTMITRPMDLGTVEKLLANNAYVDVDAFSSDVHQIFQNCYLYNGRDSPYSAMAASLEKSFETQMKRLPVAAGVMAHQSSPSARGCSAGPTAGQPYGSRVPAVPASPHRVASVRTSKPSSSPRSSSSIAGSNNIDRRLRFCSSVLSELLKKTHAAYSYPFLQPVDPVALGIPDYPLIIQRPMDISTIRQKYNAGQYTSHVEFEEDVKLMFNNCFTYNKVGDPVYVMGKQLEQVFLNKWKDLPPPPVKKKAALTKTSLKTASKSGTARKKSAAVEPTEIEDEDKLEKSSDSESEDAGSSVFGKNLEQIALMEAHMSVLQKRLVEMKEAATTANAKKKKKSKTGIAQQPAASAKSKSTKSKKSKGEPSNKAQAGGGSRRKSKSSNTVEAGGASLPPDETGAVSAIMAPAHKTRKRRASEVEFFSTKRHGGDHDRPANGGQGDDDAATEADGSRKKLAKKAKIKPSVVHFEHKQELSELINNLSEEKLETVIEIIHESMPHLREAGTEEVELDIDALDYGTFYNLYNFVVKGVRSMRSLSGDGASGGDGGAGGRQPHSSLMTDATGARAKFEFLAEAASGTFCVGDVNTGMLENKDHLDSEEMKRILSQEKLKQVTDVPGGGGAVGAAPRVSQSDVSLRQSASSDRGGNSAGETSDESLT